jgi:hypothetical protein
LVRIRHLRDVAAGHGTGESGARLCDGLEHLGFLRGVPLHRVHEIGHEIRATLQLHRDLLLRGRSALIHALDGVVTARAHQHRQREEDH